MSDAFGASAAAALDGQNFLDLDSCSQHFSRAARKVERLNSKGATYWKEIACSTEWSKWWKDERCRAKKYEKQVGNTPWLANAFTMAGH